MTIFRRRLSTRLFILLWIASAAGFAASFLPGMKAGATVSGASAFVFILALLWRLGRATPHATDLSDLAPLVVPRLGFWAMTGVVALVSMAVMVLGMAVSPALGAIGTSVLIALCIAVAWRRRLRVRLVAGGLCAGAALAWMILFLGNGDRTWAVFEAVTTPFLFVAGVLLFDHAGLGHFRLLERQFPAALRGFVWGCVLALPAALLNILGGTQAQDTWVTRPWQPLYALVPGIGEEIWARLFMTTLFYALLRPSTNARPGRALAGAVLFGTLVHTFAHGGIHPVSLVVGALLYGIPMALLFVKRDLEHAVGYHFFIDFVRYVAALVGYMP